MTTESEQRCPKCGQQIYLNVDHVCDEYTVHRDRAFAPPAIVSTDWLDAMDQLRADGWCVILKALPREMGWLIEGSRSEYDAPADDKRIGAGKWLCEVQDMRRNTLLGRRSQMAMDEAPMVAISKVVDLVKASNVGDMARLPAQPR